MKISIVTSTLKATGGVEVFTKRLSDILKEKGNSVTLITLDDLERRPENYEEVLGERFDKINKTNPQDIVISNGECGYAINHPKSINVIHGGYSAYAHAVKDLVPEEVTRKRLEKAKLQEEAARNSYVVTISQFAKRVLEEDGINVNRVINLSVDTSIFYPEFLGSQDTSLAISRGRYYEKGFDVLRRLVDKGIKLRLFSDITIDSPFVENNGFIENKNLRREYNRASVFLNPTRFEGGGLTTLEAMACGCPVLTTPTGYGYDIKDVIPNFIADSFAGFFAKYNLISNDRERYSKEALDYFWEFHNPHSFKTQWNSLINEL